MDSTLHLAAPAERLVERDARQPRRELRSFLELVQVRERIDVGLLHHVFDVVLVLHDGSRHAVEPLIVAAHEDLEQRTLPRPHALDDVRVGQRRGTTLQLFPPTQKFPYPLESPTACFVAEVRRCHLFTRRRLSSGRRHM